MTDRLRRLARGAAIAVGVTAVAGATHRLAVRRIRGRVDPIIDPLLVLPEDIVRHDVPSHDGGTIHVIERGQGRPLVLLHGIGLGAEAWAPFLHLAADRFRVLALDVRGHGRSIVGSDGVGHVAAAHDVASVLEGLDLHDAIICGHSMGGVALGAACGTHRATLQDRAAGLVFMSTAAADKYSPRAREVVDRITEWLVDRAESGRPLRVTGKADDELVFARFSFGRKPAGAAVDLAQRLGHEVSDEFRTHLWVDLQRFDNSDALEAIDLPGLVMVGGFDSQTSPTLARALAAKLGETRVEIFPGAGHQLMLERPVEVIAAIDRMVARLDAPS